MAGRKPFADAPTLVVDKKPKEEPPEVEIAGLEGLASVALVEAYCDMLRKLILGDVRGKAREYFVNEGTEKHERPKNIRGIEGVACASIELKQRSSSNGLDDEQVEELHENGLPTKLYVERAGTLAVNPQYLQNEYILTKLEKWAKRAKMEDGTPIPADFIVRQEPIQRTVVTAETIKALFKKDRETIAKLLPLVCDIGVKPTLTEEADFAFAYDLVSKLFGVMEPRVRELMQQMEEEKERKEAEKAAKKGMAPAAELAT